MTDLICKTCGKAIEPTQRMRDDSCVGGYKREHRACRYSRLPKYWKKSKEKAKVIWLEKVAAGTAPCRRCFGMPWRRPEDGRPCRCGKRWAPEVIEVALWRDSILGRAI